MNKLIILAPMIAGIIYHLAQKNIRSELSPFVTFFLVYLLSMSVMLIIALLNQNQIITEIKSLSFEDWKGISLISLGVIGIELGFLFAYRLGLPLSTSSLVTNIGMGIVLLICGLFFFKESLTSSQGFGLVLAILGIILIKA